MAEWERHLTETEFADVRLRRERIASDQAHVRKLMNRAKQRKLRKRRENNLSPR